MSARIDFWKEPAARAAGYEGARLFSVQWRGLPVLVAAPTAEAAVVAAAREHGVDWRKVEYHMEATVYRVK